MTPTVTPGVAVRLNADDAQRARDEARPDGRVQDARLENGHDRSWPSLFE